MINYLMVFCGAAFLLTSCKYYSNYDEYLNSKRPIRPQMIYTDLKDEIESKKAEINENNQSSMVLPKVVKRGKLEYPRELKIAGIVGEVCFLIKIKKDGSIEELGLYSYNHEGFIEPARKAILSSKYEKIEEETEFFLPVRFSLLLNQKEGICEVHGDIMGIFSVESDFYVCPLCYPESLPQSSQ